MMIPRAAESVAEVDLKCVRCGSSRTLDMDFHCSTCYRELEAKVNRLEAVPGILPHGINLDPLWDAINDYCVACGGSPGAIVYGDTKRQRAVLYVEASVCAALEDAFHIPQHSGLAEELADVIIRIADYCGNKQIDLGGALAAKMAYNETRPYRHGGKKL